MPASYSESVPTPLNQLAARYLKGRAAFEAQLSTPVLVWEAPASPPRDGDPDDAEASWHSTTSGGPISRPRSGEPLVFRVEKTNARANAFAMGITMGRVENNDIVVEDASVSRFHAYLQHDARRQLWTLTDADSRNGTWLGPTRLVGGRHEPVVDGAVLRLGEISLRFFLPAAFVRWLDEKSSLGGAP